MPYSYRDAVLKATRAVQVMVMVSKQVSYLKDDEQSLESSVASVSDGRVTDNHETIVKQGISVVGEDICIIISSKLHPPPG